MAKTWTDSRIRRMNEACASRRAEGFCDGSCLLVGWCAWVFEDVRRAEAREGEAMSKTKTKAKEFGVALRDGDRMAMRAAKCREGYLRMERRGDSPVAVYESLYCAVIARNKMTEGGLYVASGLVPIEAAE